MRVLCVLLFAAAAHAGNKQGDVCKVDADCVAPLGCKKTGTSARCELVCDDKTKCPADQRCVSDHGTRVCRAINDQLGI